LLLIVAALVWWAFHPTALTPNSIQSFLQQYEAWALLVYLLISSVRGCFLLPSTPFVLAGVLLFPGSRWLVFAISLLGVLIGSALIYFFSDRLGFAAVIEKKHATALAKVRSRMQKHGMLIVMAWSFFPLVPTDLVCYLAGVIRMNFLRFILAVTIGETVLIASYVFLAPALLSI